MSVPVQAGRSGALLLLFSSHMLKAQFADSFSRGKKQTRKRKALAFGQDFGLRFGVALVRLGVD